MIGGAVRNGVHFSACDGSAEQGLYFVIGMFHFKYVEEAKGADHEATEDGAEGAGRLGRRVHKVGVG